MKKEELQTYCEDYFQTVGASIQLSVPGYFEVELPTEIDKELTDRPFYWMWIEATHQTPPITTLRLKFDQNLELPAGASEGKVELVTLGSFRLNKIFESAAKRGRICRQYQLLPPSPLPRSLEPWLVIPYKVSYIADRRRDEIRSVGIHLNSGQIHSGFYDQVAQLNFADAPPDGKIQLPNQDLLTAWNKAKHYIAVELEQENHEWAEEAGQRLLDEMEQLDTYYQSILLGVDDFSEEKELLERDKQVRIQELKWRSQPKIQVEPIFMAILYIAPGLAETHTYGKSAFA